MRIVVETTSALLAIKPWKSRANIALPCILTSCTDQSRITTRLRCYIYTANSPARRGVTLIRGKTNDRGPLRPPTEDETFLIIFRLMKPRAARGDPCTRVCVHEERERERERGSVYTYISSHDSLRLLHAVGSCWLSWRQFLPRPRAAPSLWQISTAHSLRVILRPEIIVSYSRYV